MRFTRRQQVRHAERIGPGHRSEIHRLRHGGATPRAPTPIGKTGANSTSAPPFSYAIRRLIVSSKFGLPRTNSPAQRTSVKGKRQRPDASTLGRDALCRDARYRKSLLRGRRALSSINRPPGRHLPLENRFSAAEAGLSRSPFSRSAALQVRSPQQISRAFCRDSSRVI